MPTIATIIWSSIAVLNIIFIFAIIFLERRSVTATLAWIMVLSFVPVVGVILYIILGQNLSRRKIFKWEKKLHQIVQTMVARQKEQLRNDARIFGNEVVEKHSDLIMMNMNDDESALYMDNEVKIFTDGREKFDALLQDIKEAKRHIHMQYYIMRSDGLGRKICKLLMEKASEGVEVRVLYDDSGSKQFSRKLAKELRNAGVQFVPFFPGKLPLINIRMNYRNHRKLVIIDGKVGYIGGFNIGDEYLGLNKKFGYWRDTHLRIIGLSVNNIQARFILDWNQASKREVNFMRYYSSADVTDKKTSIQIVSSGPDSKIEHIKNGYIKMILSARKYVYIQTPYLIPDDSVLDALKIAALSGVDVRVMIPNKPDHPFVYWVTYANAGALLQAGVKIYTYENGFLHAKAVIIDDEVSSVGTANMDNRSFRLNFEVNAFIYDKEIAEKLAQVFYHDMEVSEKLTLEKYEQRNILIKWKESISRLLSPVL